MCGLKPPNRQDSCNVLMYMAAWKQKETLWAVKTIGGCNKMCLNILYIHIYRSDQITSDQLLSRV